LVSKPAVQIPIGLLLSLVIAVGWTVAQATEQEKEGYLAELTRRALDAKLASDREWHLLLHYRQNVFGGYTSQADDPGFFLAPDGKTDPEAELAATLAKFFSTDLLGRSRQPAQCAFVARYLWLKERLSIDDRRLPPEACERFHHWYAELNPQSITLIFPAAYMNNPASMFGHTLLRVDRKGQTEQTRILAYTINFAADVPPDAGISFALKGIFGGYKGYFSTIPYYLKVQEYRDIENRDIWEYRLNLTEEQMRRLLMHAWEMGNAYFDYFFFKENCSYQLLPLLEYANPDWHLTDRFLFWTIPSDTVRLLTQQPGLIGDIAYRPSRSTQIRRRHEHLTEEERLALGRITTDVAQIQSEEFTGLAPERQALVLDLASDYLRYRGATDEEKSDVYRDRSRAVLTARSQIKVRPADIPVPPRSEPPEQGHKTSRAGLGVGWREDEFFEELNVRAAYHDLLDPDAGYVRDAQIEMLGLSLRHYNRRDQTRLERFTLVNIVSLYPMDSLFKSFSWKVNAGMQTVRINECQLCSSGVFNGGIGGAMETHLLGREVLFAFAEIEADYSDAYDDNYRVGGGGTIGLTAELTSRWKMLLTTSYLRFPLGDRSEAVRVFFGQRYTLQQNLALRLEFNHREQHDNEAVLIIHAYF
jgi:hypothetical protein